MPSSSNAITTQQLLDEILQLDLLNLSSDTLLQLLNHMKEYNEAAIKRLEEQSKKAVGMDALAEFLYTEFEKAEISPKHLSILDNLDLLLQQGILSKKETAEERIEETTAIMQGQLGYYFTSTYGLMSIEKGPIPELKYQFIKQIDQAISTLNIKQNEEKLSSSKKTIFSNAINDLKIIRAQLVIPHTTSQQLRESFAQTKNVFGNLYDNVKAHEGLGKKVKFILEKVVSALQGIIRKLPNAHTPQSGPIPKGIHRLMQFDVLRTKSQEHTATTYKKLGVEKSEEILNNLESDKHRPHR